MIALNPATGEVIKDYPEHSDADLEQKMAQADQTFQQWKEVPFAERSRLMKQASQNLRDKKHEYGSLITQEMGKPIKEAVGEVEKCAWVCDYYADNAEKFLSEEPAESDGKEAYVAFRPLGTVLSIMPWNFPFWQVFRFAAPALMAGNTGLLKHASNVPGSALAIEQVFREAGFLEGCFQSLLISSSKVESVIADDRVAAVTLTGSEMAGKKVAATAGKYLKKCVLELGGSDPFIVLADADVAKAAEVAAKARTINTGQSCIAAKRFIVEKSVADEFEQIFSQKLSSMKMGDPMNETTELGTIARNNLRDELHDQVARSREQGANVILGGEIPAGKGAFYPATVISGQDQNIPVFAEETFGPVAAVVRVKDADEAVAVANNSRYGLGGSLWTQDLEKGKRLASQIETGSVFINGMTKSDPRLPFGGIKKSGFGRELSHYGIKEFVNIQTVWVG